MARHYELSAPPDGLAADLGPGGDRVDLLLRGLTRGGEPSRACLPPLAGALPVRALSRVPACLMDRVDPRWLAGLERRRHAARAALLAAGRDAQLELGEHVAMLLATPLLEPADPDDADARAVSGAILWLVGTLVATALAGDDDDLLADLLGRGWWPIGPVDGAFLVAPVTLARTGSRTATHARTGTQSGPGIGTQTGTQNGPGIGTQTGTQNGAGTGTQTGAGGRHG
ncbi:hypothetical protein [Nonomuraea indica]|uniref:Uncharacterized protein n=1 Tax=Nonomuraea indica TaxID=1581193 RepID=A0ABW8A474_9ACTN